MRTSPTRARRPYSQYKIRSAYLFIFLPFVLFALFRNLPLILAFFISLTSWDMTSSPSFVGLNNYLDLLKDDNFHRAFFNTVYFVGVTVPLSLVLGLVFALIVEARFIRLKSLFRTLYFLPVVSATVAISTVWNWIYNPMFGLLNDITHLLGLGHYQWLADPALTMPCIIAMSVWKSIGYNMIIYIAGLKGIPSSYYEAAVIDGASKWNVFRSVTLPLLKPITFFLVVMGMINSFQVFDQVYILSQGILKDTTNVLVFYLYQKGFSELKFGYAAAIGYYIFLMIMVVTVFQFWVNRERD